MLVGDLAQALEVNAYKDGVAWEFDKGIADHLPVFVDGLQVILDFIDDTTSSVTDMFHATLGLIE